MISASRLGSTFAIGAAGATLVAAICLTPSTRAPTPIAGVATEAPLPSSDDGVTIEARLQGSSIANVAHDEDLVVDVHAAQAGGYVRPPLSLVVVIDHSGSMSGKPLADAQEAAVRLVDHLAPEDTFAIVGFSSRAESVFRMQPANELNKRHARDAILQDIRADGGTCTSCGFDRAVAELASEPRDLGGVRRIVLMSDGHANEGVWDNGQLVAMAGDIARGGASITTVGVGLDFDEVTMTKIAEIGRGNYYFVEDTANLDAMFTRELGGLAETVASDVHVVLRDLPGARAVDAIGYPSTRDGDALVIPFADLRAGESRKVVVRVHVTPAIGADALTVTEPEVRWSGVGARRGVRHAYTRLAASLTSDAAAIAASIDHGAVQAVEAARSARALDEATAVYETQGYAAAERVLVEREHAVHMRAAAIGDAKAMDKLDADSGEALDILKSMPAAKATKAVRVKSYELAR